MPKGYLYADIVVTDPAEYEKYRQLVPATIEKYGGTYRVRGGNPEVLEGKSEPRPWPAPSQCLGEHSAELQAPVTDAFVADHDTASGQEQFDVTQTEAEAVIQPDGVLDDLGGKALGELITPGRVPRWPRAR